MKVANFEFDLEHKLILTVVWKRSPSSEDEAQYRRNIEMAIQEMAIIVGMYSEELARPIVAEMVKKIEDLWLEYNPENLERELTI